MTRLWWLVPGLAGLALLWPALAADRVLIPTDILLQNLPWSGLPTAPDGVANPLLRDLIDTYHPEQATIWERLLGRGDAGWIDGAGLGSPGWWFVGTGAMSPFVAPWFLLGLPAHAAELGALVRIAVAGAGVGLLIRDCGGSRLAAVLGGTTFAVGGFMIGWLGWPQSGVGATVGWVWWAARRSARADAPWWSVAVLAAWTAASWFAGFPAVTALLLVSAAGLAVAESGLVGRVRGSPAAASARTVLGGLARSSAGLGSGTCLAGVTLLPSLAHLGAVDLSARAEAWRGSLPLSLIARWIAPDVYGDGQAVAYWGRINSIEGAASIGTVTVVLALFAVLVGLHRPAVRHMATVAAVTGALVYGFPPLVWLLQFLPGLQSNPPARGVVLTAAAVAVLGGLGLDAAIERRRGVSEPRRQWWRRPGVVVVGAVLLAGVVVFAVARPDLEVRELADARLTDPGIRAGARDLALRSLLGAVILVVLAGAALVVLRRPWGGRRAGVRGAAVVLLVLLAIGEPLVAAAGWNTVRPVEELYPDAPGLAAVAQAVPPPARVAGPPGTLLPMTDLRYPIDDARGRRFVTAGQRALIEAAGGVFASATRWDLAPDAAGVTDAVGSLGVAGILLPTDAPPPPLPALPPTPEVIGPLLTDEPVPLQLTTTREGAPVTAVVVRVLTFGRQASGRLSVDVGGVRGTASLQGVPDGGLLEIPLSRPTRPEDGQALLEADAVTAEQAVAVGGAGGQAVGVGRTDGPWASTDVGGGLRLVAVPDPSPWVSVVARVEEAPDLASVVDRLAAGVGADAVVTTAGDRDTLRRVAGVDLDGGTPGAAELGPVQVDGRRITAVVHAGDGGAVLRVLEPGLPGWTATVDGTPVEVALVDAAFVGVGVPPGRHDVVLTWRAPLLGAGWVLTVGAAIALLGWSLLAARGPRRLRRPEVARP